MCPDTVAKKTGWSLLWLVVPVVAVLVLFVFVLPRPIDLLLAFAFIAACVGVMVVPNWRSSFFRPFADNGIFAQFGILVGSVLLMLMGVAATLNDDTKMSRRQFARQAQASAESQARHDAAEAAAQAKRDAENELNKKKSMAWRVAQRFVSERLKSPSTASFGSLFVQNHETCVKAIGNDQYNVRGWVDSQNAFGATVRVTFALTVTDEGRDKWTLDGEPIMGQR